MIMTQSDLLNTIELPPVLPGLLLAWYDKERRILPWREDPTPYHVWVSEIMLQQTRVEAVVPYYARFISELPDTSSLSQASEDRLLKLWEGLGYYSRVRNMQKAARQIMNEYGGVIPSDPKELEKLSGIGSYTAAAIASIAYQVPIVSIDGNLLRVFARLCAYGESIQTPAARRLAGHAFSSVLDKDRPGDMNQALMDLGATICLPNGSPNCERCPLSSLCAAHQAGLELEIPKAKEKPVRPIRKCTILLIRRGDSVLLRKRPDKGLLAGLYEFPNVDGMLTQSDVEALLFSWGMTVSGIHPLPNARHVFTHLIWEMSAFEAIVSDCGNTLNKDYFFQNVENIKEEAALPSAFSVYSKLL